MERRLWWRALVVVLARAAHADTTKCSVDLSSRVDCGYLNISQSLCAARGCCFVANASQTALGPPSCFFDAPGVAVKKVHVVLSNHFDAGYTDLTAEALLAARGPNTGGVINTYFQEFFPAAAALGRQLRAARKTPLRWMTQAWLVSLFLDCPPGLGIECPGPEAVSNFTEAVAAGDITWHAFPHNAQLSLASGPLVRALVHETHALDDSLNVSRKRVLSQRDVVGLPRSIVSLLNKTGVDAISVGSNGRCLPPNVPNAFRWRDRGAETFVLWHAYGYGGNNNPPHARDYTRLPGHDEVLWYAWDNDNGGPPASLDEIDQRFADARAVFGDAVEVVPSTLDAFVASVPAEIIAALPLVTADLEDSWIQGAAQSPGLLREHRALQRAFDAYVAGHSVSSAAKNFTRLLSKTIEHSFGASLPTYGQAHEYSGYPNAEFHAARDANDSTYDFFVRSWRENWQFGVEAAREAAAGDKALDGLIRAELAALAPAAAPDLKGFKAASTGEDLNLGNFDIAVATDGSLQRCAYNGTEWASAARPLGLLRYQTLTDDDFRAFREELLWDCEGGACSGSEEYGKPNATAEAGATSATVAGAVRRVLLKGATALVEVGFDEVYHEDYGAPSAAWLNYTVDGSTLHLVVTCLNKTSTRWPDAAYLSMLPARDGNWTLDQMGEQWPDPRETVDGASKQIRGIGSGVRYSDLRIDALDTPLVTFGDPRPFPMPLSPLNLSAASFPLWSNGRDLCRNHFPLDARPGINAGYWNTNYPSFIPYESLHADYAWRFSLNFDE